MSKEIDGAITGIITALLALCGIGAVYLCLIYIFWKLCY